MAVAIEEVFLIERKKKWENIFTYGESLSLKYKFTENDINEEIQKYNLFEMLSSINEQNIHDEIETDGPVGKETW